MAQKYQLVRTSVVALITAIGASAFAMPAHKLDDSNKPKSGEHKGDKGDKGKSDHKGKKDPKAPMKPGDKAPGEPH
jgi:hypothetical protein